MGKLSRTKGIKLEQNVARDFREIGFPDAITSRAGDRSQDSAGCDIINTLPFKIQCKAKKDFVPVSTLDEVKTNDGEIAVLVTKADRRGIRVVLEYENFLLLARHLLP